MKAKAFADDKFIVAKIMISMFDRVENMVEKGENAGYLHDFLFQHCFHKGFLLGHNVLARPRFHDIFAKKI